MKVPILLEVPWARTLLGVYWGKKRSGVKSALRKTGRRLARWLESYLFEQLRQNLRLSFQRNYHRLRKFELMPERKSICNEHCSRKIVCNRHRNRRLEMASKSCNRLSKSWCCGIFQPIAVQTNLSVRYLDCSQLAKLTVQLLVVAWAERLWEW